MKTPITYYGGKQKLAPIIVELIPAHTLYAEPFSGGAAVFFSKKPSQVEILNDFNGELINFYRITKEEFPLLQREILMSLHSRREHRHAWTIYNTPELFTPVQRAWAVWMLSSQGYAGQLSNVWGYDIADDSTSRKIYFNKMEFQSYYCQRLEKVQLECKDAIYIIKSRDSESSFFYCDPPYFNSHLGHYKGYTRHDFEQLLETLSRIKGKFLLSSYPSQILQDYVKNKNWNQLTFNQLVTVNIKSGKEKVKTEVLTANYSLNKNEHQLILF